MTLLIAFSAFIAPIWVSGLLFLFCIVYFRYFWQGVVVFFIFDLLYGVNLVRFDGYMFVMTTGAFLSMVLAEIIKQNTRLYGHKT